MAVDFSKFDKMVDSTKLQNEINAANVAEYDDVPAGKYVATIEKMEVKPTKAGDKLMFSVQCKISETIDAPKKQDGRWIFHNRIICGNKVTEKWNDGVAIKGVLTWLMNIIDEVEFKSYEQFANEVEEIFNDVKDNIEIEVSYDPEAFDPIKITDVFDV